MDTKHCAVDGWVDAIPVPGPRDTATFDLVVRPADFDTADEDAPDTVITCTSSNPGITHELLTAIQPGDLLRATGTLLQPPAPPALTVICGHCPDAQISGGRPKRVIRHTVRHFMALRGPQGLRSPSTKPPHHAFSPLTDRMRARVSTIHTPR